MARNFGLGCAQYLYKITNAHFLPRHQVQQPQPRAIREGVKENFQRHCLSWLRHKGRISDYTFALTDMLSGAYAGNTSA
jgi:hypothetical protein